MSPIETEPEPEAELFGPDGHYGIFVNVTEAMHYARIHYGRNWLNVCQINEKRIETNRGGEIENSRRQLRQKAFFRGSAENQRSEKRESDS